MYIRGFHLRRPDDEVESVSYSPLDDLDLLVGQHARLVDNLVDQRVRLCRLRAKNAVIKASDSAEYLILIGKSGRIHLRMTFLDSISISEHLDYLHRNPVTPLLVILMSGVLLVEIQVLGRSSSLFEYLFVASGGVSPGLLLGPISHGNFSHFVSNLGLLLLIGWPMEDWLSNKAFLGFVLFTAYMPMYLQIGYSVVTTGSAGTLGFSGAVYAFPPALLGIVLREVRTTESGFSTFGLVALAVTAAIPLTILGYLDLVSGLPSARVTHSVGYMIGLTYGLQKLRLE